VRTLRVDALWDDEASVWVATSADIAGLAAEADTLEELRTKLVDLVPELMAENGSGMDRSHGIAADRDSGKTSIPH
jgi:hypothetical protein